MLQASRRSGSTGGSVEVGGCHSNLVEVFYPPLCACLKLIQFAELNRVCRARLGAGRLQPTLQPVVAKRAFMRLAIDRIEIHHAKRAGWHTVTAAVANVLLHDDRVELGLEQGAGGAGFQARRVVAVLADIAHHEPMALIRLHLGRPVLSLADLLDEGDVPPGIGRQSPRVIVAHAGEAYMVGRQRVPFLACDLTSLAADAARCVGEEAVGPARLDLHAGRQLQFIRDHPAELQFRVLLGSCVYLHHTRSAASATASSAASTVWAIADMLFSPFS